jgi:hypothetical protein
MIAPGQLSVLLPVREREFQSQVTQLAELLGYRWCHWRPAMTQHGWRTPVSGPLGKGFPDLFLLRERDRRAMWVELKSEHGRLTPYQTAVHAAMRAAGLEVRVWRPSQIEEIAEVLR